jgi:hypothetical protein
MSYIERDHVSQALSSMKKFHFDLKAVHQKHGLCMLDNTGRRNILMSAVQEEFFAQQLSTTYKGVVSNGKTGEPDIMIGELNRELECKITSPRSGGCVSLQTDYATLLKKGPLDYLYVIADHSFEKFVVLHYIGLTVADFIAPGRSSRGKSKLMKHVAQSKCRILWGNVQNKNEKELHKLNARLEKCSGAAVKKREKILSSIAYWTQTPTNFTYEFEGANV